jgi:membrane-associated protease RseP (regulator of RpoE activity)
LALFLASLVTSCAAGARLAANFASGRPAVQIPSSLTGVLFPVRSLAELSEGVPFAVTLLAILLAHEMGHYLVCRYYRLNASLPYFLPAPGVIGTFGALIRIRSTIYSRRVLFDVAVAGPLAGFAVLLPFLAAGLSLSKVVPGIAQQGDFAFGTPLLFSLAESLMFPGVPSSDIYLHPMARAAWVGVFATALNLLPIGQLDGGHILYALFGEHHRRISLAAIAVLILLSFLYWPWRLWAAPLFFLGRKHPFIFDETRLDPKRKGVAALALLIFVISFMPAPLML